MAIFNTLHTFSKRSQIISPPVKSRSLLIPRGFGAVQAQQSTVFIKWVIPSALTSLNMSHHRIWRSKDAITVLSFSSGPVNDRLIS